MDKRTLLAVGLSLVVLLAFQYIYSPTSPLKSFKNKNDNATAVTVQSQENQSQVSETKIPEAMVSPQPDQKLFTVKTDKLTINFNETTGNINSVKINLYEKGTIGAPFFKSKYGDYFKVSSISESPKSYEIKESDGKTEVVFHFENGSLFSTRIFTVDGGYLLKYAETFSNIGDSSVQLSYTEEIGPDLGEGFEKTSYIFEGPLAYDNKKIRSKNPQKVKEAYDIENAIWVGYTSKYFAFLKLNEKPVNASIKPFNGSAVIAETMPIILNPTSKIEKSYDIFIGPKEYGILKSYDKSLEKSIDFGVFFFIAIPMLKVMNIFYGIVKNYGLAIIILTILIKIITYPLTLKSMTSMKKMKDLQPKMAEIKEKFKGDAAKMNAAMVELYKKNGANPMGGCLPMIIQIPIFFALYKALLVSIELKGAPFLFWITDLSDKDPFYVTPILMGITMFIQQRMTPAMGDPMQQKIFLFMPLIFTFMFLNFPAGLVIYWLTNNILTIIQQSIINKKTS